MVGHTEEAGKANTFAWKRSPGSHVGGRFVYFVLF